MRTEVWSICEFMAGEKPRVEKRPRMEWRGIDPKRAKQLGAAVIVAATLLISPVDVTQAQAAIATTDAHAVSTVFDERVWPIVMDIGKPLAKLMMATGCYKIMRNDVSGGWQMVYRAAIGLAALHGISAGVHIIDGVGRGLEGV